MLKRINLKTFFDLKIDTIKLLHLLTLFSFAVAQPIYSVLGLNAEFFSVRNSSPLDIILLTVFISLLLPTLWYVFIRTLSLLSSRAFSHAFTLSIIFLLFLMLLPVFSHFLNLYPKLTSILIFIISSILCYLYLTKHGLQLFITYLSISVLIFPLLFLFNSQVTQLVTPPDTVKTQSIPVSTTTPVVFLIFDELPLSTIVSKDMLIDNKRFPEFNRLAETSTWYQNTSTVGEYTIQAIPSILTGLEPSPRAKENELNTSFSNWLDLPSYRHHPKNLFTALSHNYNLNVFETVTSLCPKNLCEHTYSRNFSIEQHISDLFRDISVIYLHSISPDHIKRKLPRIDINWSQFVFNNFENFDKNEIDDDVKAFNMFIESLKPSSKPSLYFHHTTLPHSPWKFLPSGRLYNATSQPLALEPDQKWAEDSSLLEPYQRHMLQAIYADTLLGKMLDTLKQQGLFDDALIIVTADHGASFRKGDSFRIINQQNYADIVRIPLFIKSPGQNASSISTKHIQTTDILPTLFDELNEALPWKISGQAASHKPEKTNITIKVADKKGVVKEFKYNKDDISESITIKSSMMADDGLSGIYATPGYSHLIGSHPDMSCSRKLDIPIDIIDQFSDINLNEGFVPASFKLKSPFEQLHDSEVLGISLHNRLSAVLTKDSASIIDGYMYTMIDERQFIEGENSIALYAIGPCNN